MYNSSYWVSVKKSQTIRRWGSGLGIFLPKGVAHDAEFAEGDEITQTVLGPGQVMIDKKLADCEIQDYGDHVVIRVSGVSIPVKRATAVALSDKVSTNDGFSNHENGSVLLSITPDAGCLKVAMPQDTAVSLKSKLRKLGDAS